jgi:excisionase family DNA binding protein
MKHIKKVAENTAISTKTGFVSADAAARFLDLSRAMITKLCKNGQMPHRRFGRSLRIPQTWLDAQIAQLEDPSHNGPKAA